MSLHPLSPDVPIGSWEVMDLLAALVERSLVVYEEGMHGGGRYRLLETVRQYSRDRLVESKEAAIVRDRHLALFLQLAEEANTQFPGPFEVEALERVELEHDNLRAALEWSTTAEDPETGLRLATALDWFWLFQFHRREGSQWLEHLLDRPPGAPTVVRARALNAAVSLAIHAGRAGNRERQRAEECLVLSRQLGYDQGVAAALMTLAHFQESYEARIALGEESIVTAQAAGDRPSLLYALIWHWHRLDGAREPERRRAVSEELMEIAHELGSVVGISMGYRAMGWVATELGDLPRARRCFAEEFVRMVALKDWDGIHGALRALVETAAQKGDYEWTSRLLGILTVLGETTRVGSPEARSEFHSRLAAMCGAPSEAAFAAAVAEGRTMSLQRAIDYARELTEGDP